MASALGFKGRRREIMAPGRYTELFFLDEATALSAGHRPCAECPRASYLKFTRTWQAVHGDPAAGQSLPQIIDRALHTARIDRRRRKVTHEAPVESLPHGTIFMDGAEMVLVANGRHLTWSFEGYGMRDHLAGRTVTVLTPRPLIDVLRRGYAPLLHETAEAPASR